MKIHNGAVELNVEVAGGEAAPPVLFLHGITNSVATWEWLVPKLSVDHRVIRLDFRGHGASARSAGTYRFGDYVSDAVAVCEQVIGRPTVVVGHSLGGGTAAALAQQRPDLVSRMLLEDPAFQSADDTSVAEHVLGDAFALLRQSLVMFQSASMTVDALAGAVRMSPAMRGGTFGDVLEPDGIRAMASGWLDVDPTVLDPVLAKDMAPVFEAGRAIPVPTLVIAADLASPDGIVNDQTAVRVTGASPLVEIRRFDGAGHLIHDALAHRVAFLAAVHEVVAAS
jgi:pimeloyl-ACP methyl ester carboxylesterase